MMRPVFNVRVYGLLFNLQGQVLVTDELRMGIKMTKFPGGGVHAGEGLADCLKREFMEELSLEVEIDNLFYINDFYQASAFDSRDQLLSIYYQVLARETDSIQVVDQPFDFVEEADGAQVFRWMDLKAMDPGMFTFPVDKVVASMLAR